MTVMLFYHFSNVDACSFDLMCFCHACSLDLIFVLDFDVFRHLCHMLHFVWFLHVFDVVCFPKLNLFSKCASTILRNTTNSKHALYNNVRDEYGASTARVRREYGARTAR